MITLGRVFATALPLLAAPAAAQQPVPQGPEVRVDAGVGARFAWGVVTDDAGNAVVVWEGFDDDDLGIYARRLDASGAPLGAPFRANTYTEDFQLVPAVAMDADGDFVVVWSSHAQEGTGGSGIYGQRFAADGTPLGPEIHVNTATQGNQSYPGVAMSDGGAFVVVWDGPHADGTGDGIFAQRYDAAGAPAGGEFQVNTLTHGQQSEPAVAMDADGDFVVVWRGQGESGTSSTTQGRRFAADGPPLGPEFEVNTVSQGSQNFPAVAMHPGGAFVAAWGSRVDPPQDPSGLRTIDVRARRFDAAGAPLGAEFPVNTHIPGEQDAPEVALFPDGSSVVVWMSWAETGPTQDGSGWGLYGQRYDAAGSPLGAEFRVNAHTAGDQLYPSVAPLPDGDFVVAWSGEGPEGHGVYTRRFRAGTVATEPGVPSGLALSVSPNPAVSASRVRYAMPAPGPVRLSLHDVLGREVAVLASGTAAAGTHDAALDTGPLAPGAYVLRLEADGQTLTRRVTVAR